MLSLVVAVVGDELCAAVGAVHFQRVFGAARRLPVAGESDGKLFAMFSSSLFALLLSDSPFVDLLSDEPPVGAYFEGWNLAGLDHAVHRGAVQLQVFGQLVNGKNVVRDEITEGVLLGVETAKAVRPGLPLTRFFLKAST